MVNILVLEAKNPFASCVLAWLRPFPCANKPLGLIAETSCLSFAIHGVKLNARLVLWPSSGIRHANRDSALFPCAARTGIEQNPP